MSQSHHAATNWQSVALTLDSVHLTPHEAPSGALGCAGHPVVWTASAAGPGGGWAQLVTLPGSLSHTRLFLAVLIAGLFFNWLKLNFVSVVPKLHCGKM